MSRLIYVDGESGMGVAAAKTRMPKNLYEMAFSEFSGIVSRDPRVPPAERTVVGFKIDESTNPDFVGRILWHPVKLHKDSFGCCLFPKILLDEYKFMHDSYAFGFNGKEYNSLISGIFGYNDESASEMYVFSTGPTEAGVIESSMDNFFQRTGLRPLDFDKNEMTSFQNGAAETMGIIKGDKSSFGNPNFVEYGLFVPAAFVATETLVGEGARSIHVKDPCSRD
jgi:hypothetical protein